MSTFSYKYLFLMFFCAWILTDQNNHTLFCKAKLLNLVEQTKSFLLSLLKLHILYQKETY